MSAQTVALLCFLVLAIIFAGYLFTAYEFKFMKEHPDEFSKTEENSSISIEQ